MNARILLKLVNAAVALAALLLFAGSADDLKAVPVVLALGCAVHFGIDAAVAARRLRRLARARDLGEYARNVDMHPAELERAFDGADAGFSLPVRLTGLATASPSGKLGEAPLSGRPALAWSVEAELAGGVRLLPADADAARPEAWWGPVELEAGGRRFALAGPGLIDPATLEERRLPWADFAKRFPALSARVAERAELPSARLAKARVWVRETVLREGDEAEVFGQARLGSGRVTLSGNDEPEDPESLLVRARRRPASCRSTRFSRQAWVSLILGVASLAAFGLFLGLRLADTAHEGLVYVDTDGRNLRITIGEDDVWTFDPGDRRTEVELQEDDAGLRFASGTRLRIERLAVAVADLKPGDPAYPRWDGAAWILSLPLPGGAGAAASPDAAAASPDPRRGRIWFRNLTDQGVTIRVLDLDGQARGGYDWVFGAKAAAGSAEGSWISVDNVPFLVAPPDRLELTVADGHRRILSLDNAGTWRGERWRVDIVPELLAGTGALHVRNLSRLELELWTVGADGEFLHGSNPWYLDPQDGTGANKGVVLKLDGEPIAFSGRETVRYGFAEPRPLYDGPLEKLASWRDGAWRIDLRKAGE